MSRSETYARLMAAFHTRYKIIPDYEAILEATYRRLVEPGAVVVDVGAHTGRHTSVLAELAGPQGAVHAFEPLPFALETLRGRQMGAHVRIHPVALADHRGVASFVYARGAPEESGLKQKAYNQPDLVTTEAITVDVACLDDFAAEFPRLDFIKIDAEGAEVACLRGARSLLASFRPLLTVEYGYPSYSAHGLTNMSLYDEAARSGYRVCDLFGEVFDTEQAWATVCDMAYWDWCLVPQERVAEWQRKVSISPAA